MPMQFLLQNQNRRGRRKGMPVKSPVLGRHLRHIHVDDAVKRAVIAGRIRIRLRIRIRPYPSLWTMHDESAFYAHSRSKGPFTISPGLRLLWQMLCACQPSGTNFEAAPAEPPKWWPCWWWCSKWGDSASDYASGAASRKKKLGGGNLLYRGV